MKNFLCELILSCVIAGPGIKPPDELTYGTVLYSYYQQDYQAALLTTMVAEEQGRRGENPVRFELAKGSFAFHDRMFELARQTFAAVDPAELTDLDRMRLAFHLAREYYRRGEYASMSLQLEDVQFDRSWLGRKQFHVEVEYMRAEAATAAGNHVQAEALLDRLDEDEPLLAYGLFNLGVAYREADELTASRRIFEQLAGIKVSPDSTDDQKRDLIQRAKLALAFVAREQQATTQAAEVLGSLPGDGRYRDAALASYGGLAMTNEDYELAARIWLTLQNQPYWTSSTAQARLAFPVSLERLASRELALNQYRLAEQSFQDRLALLTDLSIQAEDPGWVKSLLLVFSSPDKDQDKMADLVARWREQLGHTDWLEWLATEETHQVLMEWRELLGMRDWLTLLPAELGAFEEVAAEQRRRGAQARSLLEDEQLLSKREQLQAGTEAQAQLIETLSQTDPARTQVWMMQLATDAERQLLVEFQAMRMLAETHLSGPEEQIFLDRIDRLEGMVFWRVADDRAVRIRNLTRQHSANVALLADIGGRVERVSHAESDFAAGVETDFLAFSDRADLLNADVANALNRRELALAGELRRGMAREMQEVQKYLLVTRIGIARATDQLALDQETVEGE